MKRRHCFALDLKNDPDLIAEYVRYHEHVWPEVLQSLRDVGIEDMEIYHVADRLFLVVEVNDTYSIERKARSDRANPKVQEWEDLMWKFQVALPGTPTGQKWRVMERVFKLER